MAATARALNLVGSDERDEKPKGDPTLTRATMAEWREGQRRCRARRRHMWMPYTVFQHKYHYEVVERCSSCLNRRHADFTITNHGLRIVDGWKLDYRDGYLFPHGAMAIDDDIRDELVSFDILSRKIIEVPDEDED
jgi:hypothetical protein